MKTYTAVVERSPETGLFVGFIPGFPGAHTQAESLDELNANLREVLAMLLEDGEPQIEAEFIGTQLVTGGGIAEAAGPQTARSGERALTSWFCRGPSARIAQAVSAF